MIGRPSTLRPLYFGNIIKSPAKCGDIPTPARHTAACALPPFGDEQRISLATASFPFIFYAA
jgi:hypothetical protein